jgi:glycosyltransferase involved in cell wall biosynthesis
LPTLAEGWGFPVAESLSYGKVCIASNVDSVREVGGDLVCYADPHALKNVYHLVKTFIVDADERKRWENCIRWGYRRRTWETTVNSLLARFGCHSAGNLEPLSRENRRPKLIV